MSLQLNLSLPIRELSCIDTYPTGLESLLSRLKVVYFTKQVKAFLELKFLNF